HIGQVHLDFFFQAEDGIRDRNVTGVQTCALPIFLFPETSDGMYPSSRLLLRYLLINQTNKTKTVTTTTDIIIRLRRIKNAWSSPVALLGFKMVILQPDNNKATGMNQILFISTNNPFNVIFSIPFPRLLLSKQMIMEEI